MFGTVFSTSVPSKYCLLLSSDFRNMHTKFNMASEGWEKKQWPDNERSVRNEEQLKHSGHPKFVY